MGSVLWWLNQVVKDHAQEWAKLFRVSGLGQNPKPPMPTWRVGDFLNSFERMIYGTTIGDTKGDTRSLDYSSYLYIWFFSR